MNEVAGLKIGNLRHHQRQQRIRRDVERHAEKQIGAALIQLTTELSTAYIKLKQHMTWRQCHAVDVCNIPSADNQPAAIRICFDFADYCGDLVNAVFASSEPRAQR